MRPDVGASGWAAALAGAPSAHERANVPPHPRQLHSKTYPILLHFPARHIHAVFAHLCHRLARHTRHIVVVAIDTSRMPGRFDNWAPAQESREQEPLDLRFTALGPKGYKVNPIKTSRKRKIGDYAGEEAQRVEAMDTDAAAAAALQPPPAAKRQRVEGEPYRTVRRHGRHRVNIQHHARSSVRTALHPARCHHRALALTRSTSTHVPTAPPPPPPRCLARCGRAPAPRPAPTSRP